MGLYAFGAVDHHESRINVGKGPISVFGKNLLTGGFEQVQDTFLASELNDRSAEGNSVLFFHLHQV